MVFIQVSIHFQTFGSVNVRKIQVIFRQLECELTPLGNTLTQFQRIYKQLYLVRLKNGIALLVSFKIFSYIQKIYFCISSDMLYLLIKYTQF